MSRNRGKKAKEVAVGKESKKNPTVEQREKNESPSLPISCNGEVNVRLVTQKGEWLKSNWPNIVLAFFSLLSFTVSIATFQQMGADRKASHRPELLLNPASFEFSWNSLGVEEWVRDVPEEATEKMCRMKSEHT